MKEVIKEGCNKKGMIKVKENEGMKDEMGKAEIKKVKHILRERKQRTGKGRGEKKRERREEMRECDIDRVSKEE